MKTNQFLAVLLISGTAFITNGQTIDESTTLTSGGLNAGILGSGSTYFGYEAGKVATGICNTFIGSGAGRITTIGQYNVFMGVSAGAGNITGGGNVFLGQSSGAGNTAGSENIFIGYTSGHKNTTGSGNVYVGNSSGTHPVTVNNGSNNTYMGNQSGWGSSGSNNVFLGNKAGTSIIGSDLLFIENSTSAIPLIWGNFSTDQLKFNATKVGINMNASAFPGTVSGVDTSTYRLFVNGGIVATAVRVATGWADYVFEEGYNLRPLENVECFIEENGHLPNVPSAKQVEEQGIEVGEMAKIQQEKIEELTLYIIGQNKQLKEQELKIQELEKKYAEVEDLKAAVQQLIDKK
jgi:hypothetical protein